MDLKCYLLDQMEVTQLKGNQGKANQSKCG
jgi:hypothetical protein